MKPDIVTQKSLVRVYLPSIHVRWGRSLHFLKQGSGMGLNRAATLLLLHGWVAVGRNSSWLAQLAGLPHHTGQGGWAGAKEICLCPEKTLLTELG